MNSEVIVEFLKLISSNLWIIIIFILVILFRKTIRSKLLPRVQSVKAFGVEVSLISDEILSAANSGKAKVEKNIDLGISRDHTMTVARRAERLAPILQGAQVLWVDDRPDNNISLIKLLQSLGIFVDRVKTSAEGLDMLSKFEYDLVISDMNREGNAKEGLEFLKEMKKQKLYRLTIFYIGWLIEEKGVPPYAFGITNRPDHLLHLVFDAIEREGS